MQTWEFYDLPEPPEMDDDYVNDLAQQSLEHEMSCEYSECGNDGSGTDEYTDDSDMNEDELEEYAEQEIWEFSLSLRMTRVYPRFCVTVLKPQN